VKEKLKLDEAKTKLKGEGEDKPKRTNQMVRLIKVTYLFCVSYQRLILSNIYLFREVDVVKPSLISFGVEYNGCQLNHYQKMKIVVTAKRRRKKMTIVWVSVRQYHISALFCDNPILTSILFSS